MTNIPGSLSKKFREREDKYLAPGLQKFALLAGITVESAKGSRIYDVDGNEFIDIIGGIGVNGLGHSHPKFIKAIQEQVEKVSVGSFTSPARVEFFESLSKYFPIPEGYCIQLYSGGAEAVESALRLAKSYTGRYEMVAFDGSFHGKTMGAMSLMGSDGKKGYGPFLSGSHIVPYANCYRCPLKKSYPDCALACVDLAKDQLKRSLQGKPAAVIVEPMQGTAGNVIPPKIWLSKIAEMAKSLGALLIADEMITGFGRTGKFWAVDHSEVKPDIITLGKQFGGGFPMSAVLAKKEVAQALPWAKPSGSSSSYGGNPLAAAAARATLQIIEEEKLVERSSQMGEYFLSQLKRLEKYSFVGEIRGVGLFLAVEFVKDKDTKEPLDEKITQEIFEHCVQKGLLTMAYTSSFRIQPAMTIDKESVDRSVEILDEVLGEIN